MNKNSIIRKEALSSLRGEWSIAVLLYAIYTVCSVAAGCIPLVGVLLIALPLLYALTISYLKMARGERVDVGTLFERLSQYGELITTILLNYVYVFLWSLLFVIPGIIKSYSYAMTPYIFADTELYGESAIEESMRMMKGHKMRLFLMDLGFYVLSLLSLITLGIALLWIVPYWMTSRAKFYMDLVAQREAK